MAKIAEARGRRVAIVGNAPITMDYSERIDTADHVVRFNNAFGFGDVTGSRVDDLFLVNCGGQMYEWLRANDFWNSDHVRETPKVTLPFKATDRRSGLAIFEIVDPAERDGVNFEQDVRLVLRDLGKSVSSLDPTQYVSARQTLLRHGASQHAVPSTGFLAVQAYLAQNCIEGIIELYGFGFAGWNGHAWDAEEDWINAQQAQGELKVIPVA